MARGFGSTYGTGANDVIAGGTSITKAASFSISAWVWRNGAGGSSLGQIFDIADSAANAPYVALYTTSLATRFEVGWSASLGGEAAWTCPVLSNGAWHHVAVTYDGGSLLNDPLMYVDGTSQLVVEVSPPLGSLSAVIQPPSIGNPTGGGFGWNGMIAEAAFYNGAILTVNEIAALARGASPLLVRPASLAFYAPLYGNESAEQDFGSSHLALTVTGALRQNHAPTQQRF